MFTVACCLLLPLAAAADNYPQWVTVSPAPTRDRAVTIFAPTSINADHSYVLTWDMRVEGEKVWRFRADFAGVTVRFRDANGLMPANVEKQTSCWQTLDWQRAWLVIDPPPGAQTLDATMAIVSKEDLPGRFRVRDVRLIDLNNPTPLKENEGELLVAVKDEKGNDTAARVYILDDTGQGVAPANTYAYTQGTRCFELIDPRLATIALPAGRYTVRATKGFDRAQASATVTVQAAQRHAVTLTVQPQFEYPMDHWLAVDHHTHLYRHGGSLYPMMDLNDVLRIAEAEGLDYVPFQGADKAFENRGERQNTQCVMDYTQELTRDFWGHICPIYNEWNIVPTASASANGSLEVFGSAAPMNMDYIAAIRAGAVTYAHPYGPLRTGSEYSALEDPKAGLIAREWPIDVALGVPCAIDILAKEDANGEFVLKLRDYMRLLNLGFHCGATGSTDFHLDQGREPIGGLRTYAFAEKNDWKSVAAAYNNGNTFATNGPLVDVRLSGCMPGDTLKSERPLTAEMTLRAESLWGITCAKIWMNGNLEREILAGDGAIRPEPPDRPNYTVRIERSGWMLVTVEGPSSPDVMTSPEGKPCVPGQFAITSPIYIEIKGQPAPADADAARYFVGWCDAVRRGFDTLCAQQDAAGESVPAATRNAIYERVEKARRIFNKKAK